MNLEIAGVLHPEIFEIAERNEGPLNSLEGFPRDIGRLLHFTVLKGRDYAIAKCGPESTGSPKHEPPLQMYKAFLLPACLTAAGRGLLVTGLYVIGDGSKGPDGVLYLFPISGLIFGGGLCLFIDRFMN
jgi:hypothetical protein